MENAQQQSLAQIFRNQQNKELSSDQEDQLRDQVSVSRMQHRKPIKDPFSDQQESDSDTEVSQMTSSMSPFPPKPSKTKTALEMAQSQMKWNKEEQIQLDVLAKLDGNGMKDKKIRQLATKFKSMNVVYEKEKTIRKNLENQLNSMIKANQQIKKTGEERKGSLEKSMISRSEKSEKCNQCQELDKKVMDMRLKNQNMKTQLNKAHRLISREVGQNFDIDAALNEDNAWKGRQQKIERLKGRVRDLEQKLQNNGVNVSHMSGFTQMTSANLTNKNSFGSTQRSSLMAENKRKQFDNLKIQVEALKSQNDLLQNKLKSINSRKQTLESQIKDIKGEYEKKKILLMEKSQNDDKFISLLKQENQKLKKNQRVVTKVVYKDSKENNEDVQGFKREIELLKKKLAKAKASSAQNNPQIMPTTFASNEKIEKNVVKGQARSISREKRRQLEEEYLNNPKYLKKMSPQDEQEIYKAWKDSKKKI